MIKFTIILIIVYVVLWEFTKFYVNSLSDLEKIRLAYKQFTTGQLIWFGLLTLMRVASIILAAVSVILLVVKYL